MSQNGLNPELELEGNSCMHVHNMINSEKNIINTKYNTYQWAKEIEYTQHMKYKTVLHLRMITHIIAI